MEVVNLSKNNTGKNACTTRNLLTSCSFVAQRGLACVVLEAIISQLPVTALFGLRKQLEIVTGRARSTREWFERHLRNFPRET
jgi:hypothetical protein